jgi:hypothetical protein
MIVYFIASRKDILTRIEELRRFVKLIHQEGHSLSLDWIESSYDNTLKLGHDGMDWSVVYKDTIEAITRSDVVIGDASGQSFSVGYQVAEAIQMKKPVLLLHSEQKEKLPFASGIKEANVVFKTYNKDNLEKIVKQFLEDNDIKTKDMRFNFFIDRNIYNYLRWSSHKTGKTKAEVLRALVQREIERKEDC